jgi:hypothetical protein
MPANRVFAMSRVNYAFDEAALRQYAKPDGRTLRTPMRAKLRNRRFLRGAMETAGLFAFGFGSTGLLAHFAAGVFLISRMSALAPLIGS